MSKKNEAPHFGAQLKKLRLRHGIKGTSEMAKLMKTSPANVGKIENNEYPTTRTMSKYADALGYNAAIVFRRKKE